MSSQDLSSRGRSPLSLILLFGATLGAYWPIRLHALYAELARSTPRPTRLTPRAAVLLAVTPLVNLVALAYFAIDLPRATRRVTGRDTEVLSILLLLPAAGGVAAALLCARALKLNPQSAEVHVAAGQGFSMEQRYAEAAAEFERAIESQPTLFDAYYYYARACFKSGALKNRCSCSSKRKVSDRRTTILLTW